MINKSEEVKLEKKDSLLNGIWIPISVLVGLTVFFGIYVYIYMLDHRVEGLVSVDAPDFMISENVECFYDTGRVIETKSENTPDGISFTGMVNGSFCIYRFELHGEEITVKPEITFYRSDPEKAEKWSAVFDLYKTDGKWDAVVRGTRNRNDWTTVECTDIEKNGIFLNYWGEGACLQIRDPY